MKYIKGYTEVGNAFTILAVTIVGITGYAFSEEMDKEIRSSDIYIEQASVPKPSDTYEIKEFFNMIDDGEVQKAAEKLSDNKLLTIEDLSNIEYIKIRTIEPYRPVSWKEGNRTYLLRLNVQIKPGSNTKEWDNGENVRIISLERKSEDWSIANISKAQQ